MKPLIILLCAVATLAAAEPTEADKAVLTLVIQEQIAAYNREDIKAIMATMHTKSPAYNATQDLLKKIVASYDLKYIVEDLVVISVEADEAQVSFTQQTEKVSGPKFRNNRVKGVHTFRREAGQWRLYDTKLVGTEYLDQPQGGLQD